MINPELYHNEIYKELLSNGMSKNRILDIAALRIRLEKKQYFDGKILPHDESEIFVDCGAYDGETALNFIKWAGGSDKYKKIICFEPDEKNLEVCMKTLSGFHDVQYEKTGLWDHKDILRFNSAKMSSSVSNDGGTEIEVSTIDDICGEIPVTFIKMDIEGSELRALKGAKNTILKNKPKLAICIYHRAEDIFEIPRYIDDLAPGI